MPPKYLIRRSKDDRSVVFARQAKRLGVRPLGELSASAAGESLTGVHVINETITTTADGVFYAMKNIPFEYFYTREFSPNRNLTALKSIGDDRNSTIEGLNVILGANILEPPGGSDLSSYKPIMDTCSFTATEGLQFRFTPPVSSGSNTPTFYVYESADDDVAFPSWVKQDEGSNINSSITGIAPAHSGGDEDDLYTFLLKVANPFGCSSVSVSAYVAARTTNTPFNMAVELDSNTDVMRTLFGSDDTYFPYINQTQFRNMWMDYFPWTRLTNGDGRGWTQAFIFRIGRTSSFGNYDSGYPWVCGTTDNDNATRFDNSYRLYTSNTNFQDTTVSIPFAFGAGTTDKIVIDSFKLAPGYTANRAMNSNATEYWSEWFALVMTFDGGTTGGSNPADVDSWFSRFKFYTIDLYDPTNLPMFEHVADEKRYDGNGFPVDETDLVNPGKLFIDLAPDETISFQGGTRSPGYPAANPVLSIGRAIVNHQAIKMQIASHVTYEDVITTEDDIRKIIIDPEAFRISKGTIDGKTNRIYLMGDGENDTYTSNGRPEIYNTIATTFPETDSDSGYSTSASTRLGGYAGDPIYKPVLIPSLSGIPGPSYQTDFNFGVERRLDTSRFKIIETGNNARDDYNFQNPLAKKHGSTASPWTFAHVYWGSNERGTYLGATNIVEANGTAASGGLAVGQLHNDRNYVVGIGADPMVTNTDNSPEANTLGMIRWRTQDRVTTYDEWNAVVVTYDGGVIDNTATTADTINRVKVYKVALSGDNPVTEYPIGENILLGPGAQMGLSGSQFKMSWGTLGHSSPMSGTVASMAVLSDCLTSTGDIRQVIKDPMKYILNNSITGRGNAGLNRVYLFGDGEDDQYVNTLNNLPVTGDNEVYGTFKNQVDVSATGYARQHVNQQSDDNYTATSDFTMYVWDTHAPVTGALVSINVPTLPV